MKKIAAIGLALFAATAQAEQLNETEIVSRFQSLAPFKVNTIEPSPLANMYQLITDKGVFYMTKDGQHIISGSIHATSSGLPNLTKQRLQQDSKIALSELRDSFVTFEAPNQKHEIVVFYDASCPYCHRLHSQVGELNAKGVTVHYAGWPRTGIQDRSNPDNYSPGFLDLQSIWCSDSPKAAFNRSATGGYVEPKACDTKIEAHFALGEKMGVRGTPAVFDMNANTVVQGAAPTEQILSALEKLQ